MSSKPKLLGGKSSVPFESLRLAVGTAMSLETRMPRARYPVKYVGHLLDRSLLVTLPQHTGGPALLTDGTPVTLRFMAANRACAFTTRVLRSAHLPFVHLHLAYPRQVEAVRVREQVRMETALVVSVDAIDEACFDTGWPRQALCRELSLGGARIESTQELGEVGERRYISARVQVGEIDQVLLLLGEIRFVEEVQEAGEPGLRVSHGVEFVEPDEETRLILTAYLYQEMLAERGLL